MSTSEEKIIELESQIAEIQNRNFRVEADKAWETSKFRMFAIIAITYIVIAVALYFIKVPRIWLNAVIPTLGFILSIQTLPVIKRWWISKYYGRR